MNWMTVKDVASYLKLSEMMIYKLAQNGDIPSAKIGSAWRFSQTEIDNWLLAKTKTSSGLPESVQQVATELVHAFKDKFKNNFVSAFIFGSYAKGTATNESDLDMLIVLKTIKDYWKTKSDINEIAYNLTFGEGTSIVVAPILVSEDEFLNSTSPLLINIHKEGKRAA